ncbi:uncharacterized protein LOC124145435 isoform X3 [Haliotis rufescens]|uniref:uncharacterized protein LOC124145435 isoform X3 n=1 Tax=Haliotis rufescens TaxID=6454 RepID=UPI00201FA079|nr:uncharacterized protein LOC124145435 isoform X3 [Haliotis rufescens]
MLLFVAGLITMSCLTLSVLSADDGRDALLYKVDIFLPPNEGRDEIADILHIQETVKDLSDIDVLFSFKELGNPRIILGLSTLEYNEMLEWTLERDAALARSGQQMTMFRALGEYPLELIYFGAVTQHRIEEYEEYLHGPRDFENVLQESKTLIITQDSAKETNPMRNAV